MLLKLKNKNSTYYRKDSNRLGKRKYRLLSKCRLLPTEIGKPIQFTFSITDLSKYIQLPLNISTMDDSTDSDDKSIDRIDIFDKLIKKSSNDKPLSRNESYKAAKINGVIMHEYYLERRKL